MAEPIEARGSDVVLPGTEAISLTIDIVSAFVSNNSLPPADLPVLLASVHKAIAGLSSGAAASASAVPVAEVEKPTPSQIRKSVTPDGIVSFLDGKAYKTMKRHLGTHGLDPHSYRQRYGLPSDYPMVAPNYAAHRSALAKTIGLGRVGGMAERAGTSASASARKPRASKKAA